MQIENSNLSLMLFPKKKIYNKFNILLQLLDLQAGTYWRYWTILSFSYYLRLIVNYQRFILQIEKCGGCIFPQKTFSFFQRVIFSVDIATFEKMVARRKTRAHLGYRMLKHRFLTCVA